MTRKTRPDPPFSAGRRTVAEEVVRYFHGSATIYGPAENHPAAWTEHHFDCPHRHTDYDKAQRCGEQLSRRLVREFNAETIPLLKSTPCDIYLHREQGFRDEPETFMLACRAHHTCAGKLIPSEAEARAADWTCPWRRYSPHHP